MSVKRTKEVSVSHSRNINKCLKNSSCINGGTHSGLSCGLVRSQVSGLVRGKIRRLSGCRGVVLPTLVSATLLALVACGSSSNSSSTDATVNIAEANVLTVASWGGQYEFSQRKAYHEPWTADSGIAVNSVTHDSTLDELKNQVETDSVIWDIVDVELSQAHDLCVEGFLEPIDKSVLLSAPDGTAAADDFFPGTLQECAVPNIVWSTVITYNSDNVNLAPSSIADFFDLDTFPGKRGLRRNPETILEMALMADGVDPRDVYSILSSDEGVDRALGKLNQIKSEIVWWDSGTEAADLVADGTAVMSTAFNTRVFNHNLENDNEELSVLWDGQVWNLDMWVIPRGAPNRDSALNFLEQATSTEALAAQASFIAYGPSRQSSQELVGTHHESGVDMRSFIGTSPQNAQNAVLHDAQFWVERGNAIRIKFGIWLVE